MQPALVNHCVFAYFPALHRRGPKNIKILDAKSQTAVSAFATQLTETGRRARLQNDHVRVVPFSMKRAGCRGGVPTQTVREPKFMDCRRLIFCGTEK